MKTAHTPGPWLVRPNGWQITNADDGLVAVTHNETEQPGLLPHPESVANAHLIAAAPELFEALKLALIFHDGGPWTSEKAQEWSNGLTRLMGPAIERRDLPSNEATTKNLCNAVRAAISKATGGTP